MRTCGRGQGSTEGSRRWDSLGYIEGFPISDLRAKIMKRVEVRAGPEGSIVYLRRSPDAVVGCGSSMWGGFSFRGLLARAIQGLCLFTIMLSIPLLSI